MKYTYADIIFDPNDPRLEGAIGKECYGADNPTEVLANANKKDLWGTLESVRKDSLNCFPFEVSFDNEKERLYDCIILKKEKAPKYKPFDLSNEEVRNSLRGKWIKLKEDDTGTQIELCISAFAYTPLEDKEDSFYKIIDDTYYWVVITPSWAITAEKLLEQFTFLDGSPCGTLEEDA